MKAFLSLLIALILCMATSAYAQVDARMLRQPDVSATHITFVYAGDVWVVPKSGGTAQRLSSPAGEESFPRFSPDGSWIGFSGNYDGNTDVYTVPAMGGDLTRITHHPMNDRILDWYPEGQALLYASAMESEKQRFNQLYRTDVDGGLPEKLPIPYGEFGSLSPDGRTLAFIPISRDFRTWKRYRGGMAPDIWFFDLESLESENVTSNDANDTQPMWHGETLYFLSDRDDYQRYNLWAYDRSTGETRQVTHFTDFDVHFPSIGTSDIVFEAGGQLHLLNLSGEESHIVDVSVVTDRATLRPRAEKVESTIFTAGISPTGKRMIFAARGDVFTVPAEHGPIRNLTRTPGVAERYPAWSPDGKHVAYFTDAPGEYELAVRAADGTGEEEILTELGPGFRYNLYWSPDSKKLAFVDQAMRIQVFDRGTGETREVDQDLYMFHGALSNFEVGWSPDSRWLAYSRSRGDRNSAVYLYDTDEHERHQVTSGYYNDTRPTFDPAGEYMYFLSNRTLSPSYSDLDNSWVYANATNVVAAPLRSDVESPVGPRNDEEGGGEEEEEEGGEEEEDEEGEEEGKEEEEEEEVVEPVVIDVEGLEGRVVVLPPAPGNYTALRGAEGKVVYHRRPLTGSGEEKAPIVYFDLEEREEKTVLADADGYDLSGDGKKLAVLNDGKYYIVDLAADQTLKTPLRIGEMEVVVEPMAEWKQIFMDVWRFQRDYFYDEGMHGVDWDEMARRYGALIEDAVTRWDVNYVIGELIAELNASHTYRGGGDLEDSPQRSVGLLGVDWTLENGAYRIEEIVEGGPWDSEVRSPLRRPGVEVSEGDYVLAVNGRPIDTSKDPWASFQGLAGQPLVLTVNDRPSMDGAREVLVEPLDDETRLRHLQWIESNRRRVDEATDGRVGYIYVPDTGVGGQTELVRQFNAQYTKDALIIDERFNSGGQIPDRFIELLNRPALAYWDVRDGRNWQWPPVAHFGPKVMLINGWSGSGGDAFPYYFREAGLGPLIGSRTWGGLIGITGAPPLIDGGGVTVPTFRMYGTDGQWFAEGHGVEPDIHVPEDPTALAQGVDPQLERAIDETLRMLREKPAGEPVPPAPEIRIAPAVGGSR